MNFKILTISISAITFMGTSLLAEVFPGRKGFDRYLRTPGNQESSPA